jgi:threonine synthase
MSSFLFQCIDCGKHHVPDEVEYLCPECAASRKAMEPLPGLLRCVFDLEAAAKFFTREKLEASKAHGFARYAPLLPLRSIEALPPLVTGRTPLRAAERLRAELALTRLWLKDDTVQPTGSFKDRASALAVAAARERGRGVVATASTGNAATALAGQAASVGMDCVIFVPEKAPPAKLAQIGIYGATLVPVAGTYDEAFELSIEACDAFGWYNRNTAYNPFTVEGKKTAALEIWEQLGYATPDWVIVPTGDGVIAAGIEKGFADLLALRLIDRMPRIALVQAEGCQPIVRAFKAKAEVVQPEGKPRSIADSISVGVPRAGRWVMKALAATNGVAVAVSDEEILSSIALIGRTSGVFAEPAAAASIAGLTRLVSLGTIASDETVVALITGSGLKDVPAAMKSFKMPKAIAPKLEAVKKLFSQ